MNFFSFSLGRHSVKQAQKQQQRQLPTTNFSTTKLLWLYAHQKWSAKWKWLNEKTKLTQLWCLEKQEKGVRKRQQNKLRLHTIFLNFRSTWCWQARRFVFGWQLLERESERVSSEIEFITAGFCTKSTAAAGGRNRSRSKYTEKSKSTTNARRGRGCCCCCGKRRSASTGKNGTEQQLPLFVVHITEVK